ncbi:hypothetical protein LELG_00528 [Lodderomyces elongisporus NRRL YB-4239]|uniref:RNA polymerase II-associated protein 3 n=1 Tax=Lodderomyces elongisporus (strain ATCC 11503 / CBS 2605 / JCM 1781 / NBRC 1676 / NRRL YB-4239) TaxID=379508 RepID=A5DT42_LODEL|nr:hypothetical protein LELG_00528 [Lodderomyces elongisporus NRRL YB-4239]
MTLAEELKLEGNKAFQLKQYKKAAKIYRDAIQLDLYNPVLYSNRAQCFLNLQDYERAYRDTVSGLNLSGNQTKQLTIKLQYRKGLALKGLQRWAKAKIAFDDVLKLDPNNQAAKNELDQLANIASDAIETETTTAAIADRCKNGDELRQDINIQVEKVYTLPQKFTDLLNNRQASEEKKQERKKEETLPQVSSPSSAELEPTSMAVEREIENIFGTLRKPKPTLEAKVTSPSTAPTRPPILHNNNSSLPSSSSSSSFSFFSSNNNKSKIASFDDLDKLPLKLLSALKNLPQTKKASAYRYVLKQEPQTYQTMFSQAGIETDFLQFFLEASVFSLGNGTSHQQIQIQTQKQQQQPEQQEQVELIANHIRQFATFKRFDLAMTMCDDDLKNVLLQKMESINPETASSISQYIV